MIKKRIDTETSDEEYKRVLRTVPRDMIYQSDMVYHSYMVDNSSSVIHSSCIEESSAVKWSSSISYSYGISHCRALENCAFCHGIKGASNRIFNKEVTEERALEIISSLKCLWIPEFDELDDYSASPWRDMPPKMINFIKSLTEYSEELYKKITS